VTHVLHCARVLLCAALAATDALAVRHPPPVEDAIPPTTTTPPPQTATAPTATATAPTATAPTTTTTATARTTRRRPLRVAVYDLGVAGGVDARVGRIVTDALVVELRKLQGVSVVSLDEVRALVAHEANRQATGCDDDGCLAEIADALGVDVLVSGTLSTLGDERVFVVRRLSTTEATATATETRRLVPAAGEEFLAAVGPVVERLFAGHALQAGRVRGVDARVALLLNPPPLPVWATLVVGGGAFVAGAGAAVAATTLYARQDAYDEAQRAAKDAGRSVAGQQLVATRDEGVAWATATNALIGVTLALGVGAAVMAPWTDWGGAGDDVTP
jgi:hypothetical protein